MPRKKVPLPVRSLAEVIEAYPAYRQSLLSDFDDCALSALFGLEGGGRYTNDAQARGILFHRAAAKILEYMRAEGIVKCPVEKGLQILYEVCRQHDVPDSEVVIPSARERRVLRIVMIKFCHENQFGMKRLIAVERRLTHTVSYVDHRTGQPVYRDITGMPDAILARPRTAQINMTGVEILDWKTTRKAPPEGPKRDDQDFKKAMHWDDPEHLSYQGYFQQRLYGYLALCEYPNIDYVMLREFYPFDKAVRYGTVLRSDMESLEEEFSMLVELLDRALQKGSQSDIFVPSPGRHCAYCPAKTRCPLDAMDRIKEGGIGSWAEAEAAAGEYVQAKYAKENLHEALKAWVEAHGPIPVKNAKGRMVLRWRNNTTGNGRTFGVYVPEDSDRGPRGMDEAHYEALSAEADTNIEEAFAEVAGRGKAT